MNIKLIRLLVFFSIGLCLVIIAEWSYTSYAQHRLLTAIASKTGQDYNLDQLPAIELKKQPEENYTDLVTRPLFIKGRRPVDEPGHEAEQAAVSAAAKSLNFDWQLTGVYGTPEHLSALFSRSKSKVARDNFRKITLGKDIDGWKLTEISRDRVMLKQGSNEKELLLRKPKTKVSAQRDNNATPIVQPVTPAAIPPVAPAAIPEPAADTDKNNNEGSSEGNQ